MMVMMACHTNPLEKITLLKLCSKPYIMSLVAIGTRKKFMLSIGELSKRTGVKIPTIRYYEQMGLIDAPERSSGNQRRYSKIGLERLSFIRHSRDLGLSIDDIRELIKLNHHPQMPCDDAHHIALRHLQSVRERIIKLKRLEKELKRITAITDAGIVGNCNVIQSLADHRLCETEH
jgi:DNA-binding transcriptional MerR regulator